jgi:xylulokinase
LLLGIDVGTTNIKAVLVTPDGEVVAQAHTTYPTQHVQSGWVEQNPEDWWQGVVTVVRQVCATAVPARIAGVGVSGQGCSVTLLDKCGAVVRPALIWMDTRSEAQCETLRQRCGEDILRLNGKRPAPYNADPKLMWLLEHEPKAIEQAVTSVTATGYVNFRLTGATVMNKSDASILFAFDLTCEQWSPALITAFGLPERLYPLVADSQTVIGAITAVAAHQLGLPVGLPVIAGGEDTSSAGLALGVAAPGQTFLSLGTAGTVYVATDSVLVHPQLLTFLHVLQNKVLFGGSMIAAGAALDWCRGLLPGNLSHEELTYLAASSEPGAGGVLFLPYLSGELQPINDGHARGVFFGMSFGTEGADLVRAVMEGVAFAIDHNLHIIRKMGVAIQHIRAVGAPARNPLWCQMIADISGCLVEIIPDHVGAPLGNALLCAAALGLIDDPVTVAETGNRNLQVYQPTAHDRYMVLADIYRSLYPALKPHFAQLHRA